MAQIDIGLETYQGYADQDAADFYLAADFNAAAWREADLDTKGRALVTATRVLDRQSWQGTRTVADQPLAWPRAGIAGVDQAGVPLAVISALIELAAQIIGGYDAANKASTASGVKRQKAGSVEIEYFANNQGGPDGSGYRLPLPVWELISVYLAGQGGGLSGAIASGVCGDTAFGQDYQVSLYGGVGNFERDGY